MYHEELESLTAAYPSLEEHSSGCPFTIYLHYLKVLTNVGMTSIHTIDYHGPSFPFNSSNLFCPIQEALESLQPDKPVSDAFYAGGKKQISKHLHLLTCSHESSFTETGSQAVSYTTGVPAMIGAKLMLQRNGSRPGYGIWSILIQIPSWKTLIPLDSPGRLRRETLSSGTPAPELFTTSSGSTMHEPPVKHRP